MNGPSDNTRIERVFDLLMGTPEDQWEELARAECVGHEGLAEQALTLARSASRGQAYLDTLARRIGIPQGAHRRDGMIGKTVGAYRLVRLLGRGGMGSVYLAERDDDDFHVRAAVKLVATGLLSDTARQRFLSERRILSNLEHPNIARLFDGGITDDGTPYFVMEYVDGEPIDRYCDRRHLGIRERVRLAVQVCAAVAHAHQNLVIHRDLKPENVLVDGRGTVKLLDFGIAQVLDSSQGSLTETAQPHPMTLAYASPEQVRRLPLGTAADVYSLGVLVYRILTGRHPYPLLGASLADTQKMICESDPTAPGRALQRTSPDPDAGGAVGATEPSSGELAALRGATVTQVKKELSGDLGLILLTALRKEPERRYPSVADFSADLLRYLDGLPVSARPDTQTYRLRRFVGRHRAGVGVAAVMGILIISLTGLAIRYTLDTRAQAARIAAESEATQEVFGFMVDVFRLADPGEGGGDTLTVRAALARGAENQRTRLSQRPDLRIRLLPAIAEAYEGLGLEREALPLLEEAMELQPTNGTLADTVVGRLAAKLGAGYRAVGAQGDALRQYERAVSVYDAAGADSLLIAEALGGMAEALEALGNVDSAQVLVSRSRDLMRRRLDPGDARILTRDIAYARILSLIGKADSAIALLEDVVIRGEAQEEPPGETLARALNNLGAYQRRGHDLAGAVRSYRKCLDEYWDWIALSERQVLLVNLASALSNQGDTTGALEVLQHRLALSREWWPSGHWRVGKAASDLGKAYRMFGDPAHAVAPLQEGLEMYQRTLGADHRWTANTESALGEVLGETGRAADAERHLLAAYRKLETAGGTGDAWTRSAARRLADFYDRRGRGKEAAPYRAVADGAGSDGS